VTVDVDVDAIVDGVGDVNEPRNAGSVDPMGGRARLPAPRRVAVAVDARRPSRMWTVLLTADR
jgi:hypothetical protein